MLGLEAGVEWTCEDFPCTLQTDQSWRIRLRRSVRKRQEMIPRISGNRLSEGNMKTGGKPGSWHKDFLVLQRSIEIRQKICLCKIIGS